MHLSDGDRIRGLLGTYCRLIDEGDFGGLGELMSRATLKDESGQVVATGAKEVTDLYAATVRLHKDETPATQHVVANTTFDEPGPDGTVVARSSYVVFQAVGARIPLQPIVTGDYVDTFAQDDDGSWYFTERRFRIGRTGDLARHLRYNADEGLP
ncbi:MAG TPA: nuclear transport factor 2 family protein [Nocardioides sp.]|nr:nuclear transport factor 2 family protein [Nocardioides sp.]